MSKAQHTPGPWKILPEECTKPYIRIRGTVFGGRYKVANVLAPAYEGIPDREREETVANARLIAAAPDMLSALRRAVLALAFASETSDAMRDNYEAVRAAIAKATGEQP